MPAVDGGSALILHDDCPYSTGDIVENIQLAKPLLCFIHACDPAPAGSGKDLFSLHELDMAFLGTGAYLLASRWRVSDEAAGLFAKCFYKLLLVKGKSIGKAVCGARRICRHLHPDDLAWASYILYGDPRVNFPRG